MNNDNGQTPELAERAAFDATGILWKNEELALAKLREQYDILFDSNTGEVNCTDAKGNQIRLSDALRNLATSEEGAVLADGRSVRFLSKADFPDTKSKAAFIAANGIREWEKMSQNRPTVTGTPKTMDEFRKLPRTEKVKLVNAKGLKWVESLRNDLTEAERLRQAGIRLDRTPRKNK